MVLAVANHAPHGRQHQHQHHGHMTRRALTLSSAIFLSCFLFGYFLLEKKLLPRKWWRPVSRFYFYPMMYPSLLMRLLSGKPYFTDIDGGVMLGAGLFLHAEVALARYMRDEVDRTFVLWRAVGEAMFLFQDDETRVAMVVAEVPDEALRASESTAWALVSIGLLVAVTAPMMRRRSSRKKG